MCGRDQIITFDSREGKLKQFREFIWKMYSGTEKLIYLLPILLRYNLYKPYNWSALKVQLDVFLVIKSADLYNRYHYPILKHFCLPKKIYQVYMQLLPVPTPCPGNHLSIVSTDLLLLEISYKWNYIIYGLMCLA